MNTAVPHNGPIDRLVTHDTEPAMPGQSLTRDARSALTRCLNSLDSLDDEQRGRVLGSLMAFYGGRT